jgi:hypothetical protein
MFRLFSKTHLPAVTHKIVYTQLAKSQKMRDFLRHSINRRLFFFVWLVYLMLLRRQQLQLQRNDPQMTQWRNS